MSDCTHDCSSCEHKCDNESFLEKTNNQSSVKKVYAVISGKGGVGKSFTTSVLASVAARKGYKTAIMDADVTGPSIPKVFGLTDNCTADDTGIYPAVTKNGIEVISINLLMDDPKQPVIWRGPVIAGVIKQFWTDVNWGDVDVMFIDCPPGTGDVPLTVFQSIPVNGIIVVTSPQDLVSMIVAKAVNMAKMMNIPILGVVENMSYFVCDKCKEKHYIYGESHVDEIAKSYGIENVLRVPILPEAAKKSDEGKIEEFILPDTEAFFDKLTEK